MRWKGGRPVRLRLRLRVMRICLWTICVRIGFKLQKDAIVLKRYLAGSNGFASVLE